MFNQIIIMLVAFSIGTIWCQEEVPSISVSDLPPALAGEVDDETVKRIQNQSLSAFREKCEKNGGPNAFDITKNATIKLGQCVSGLINPEQLNKEIEDAKPQGTVDEVFKKQDLNAARGAAKIKYKKSPKKKGVISMFEMRYCAKKPLFEECIKNNTEDAQRCFSSDEQNKIKTVVFNVTAQLAEFICFKEGDRIALFIAEGGQECITDKQEGLKACFKGTTGADTNITESFDPSSLSNFTLSFDEGQCAKFFELQECVVSVLDECPKPTSANIVESLFKFVRKSTPCKNFKNPNTQAGSGASNIFVAMTTIVMAALTFMFV